MKRITYTPEPGTDIHYCCLTVADLANKEMATVVFDFNGITIEAVPPTSCATLEGAWRMQLDKDAREYRESPKGIADAKARAEQVTKRQDSVSALIKSLPGLLRLKDCDWTNGITRNDVLMGWLYTLSIDGDGTGVDWNKAAGLKGGAMEWVASLFEANGYRENDHVGQKPEWFNTRERMAHYIVGQAINCLRMGHGPHPITEKFVRAYFKLPQAK